MLQLELKRAFEREPLFGLSPGRAPLLCEPVRHPVELASELRKLAAPARHLHTVTEVSAPYGSRAPEQFLDRERKPLARDDEDDNKDGPEKKHRHQNHLASRARYVGFDKR